MTIKKNLVADLGGTNIRFALCAPNSTTLDSVKRYSIRDYESIDHLIEVYLGDINADSNVTLDAVCIAIAGPINDGVVAMTNCDWTLSTAALSNTLGINCVEFINDFAAIAHAVPYLKKDELLAIGCSDTCVKQSHSTNGPITVFGPGTGLGAALLVPLSKPSNDRYQYHYTVLPTEGGHAGLSARSEQELYVFNYWRKKGCRINREFFVCGTGIERIFEALCVANDSIDHKKLSVAQIQQLGCTKQHKIATEAMHLFCAFLGSATGDQVLSTGSTGGAVLAGGILPKFPEFLNNSEFRARFESKGVMSNYNKAISTQLIVAEQPGLIGAAAYLLQEKI